MIVPGESARLVSFRSTLYDLPILEFRPYRSFSGNQSSSVMFQLFANADVPSRYREVGAPAGPSALSLGTIWSLGLRMVFDWRYYR